MSLHEFFGHSFSRKEPFDHSRNTTSAVLLYVWQKTCRCERSEAISDRFSSCEIASLRSQRQKVPAASKMDPL